LIPNFNYIPVFNEIWITCMVRWYPISFSLILFQIFAIQEAKNFFYYFPGTDGSTSIAFRERQYYPAPQGTNIGAHMPVRPGSSDSAPFVHGGYAPRSAHHTTVRNYLPPAFATSSHSSVVRCEPSNPHYQPAIPSYPPATSAASSSAQPLHAEAAASLRHPRHVSVGHTGSARSRRMRDSFHCFNPSTIEDNNLGRSAAEVDNVFVLSLLFQHTTHFGIVSDLVAPFLKRFMMLDQLVIHESREAFDPHWDMRLDIDDMSYEVGKTFLASYCLLATVA
jgi:hypothetical protein